MATVHVEDGTVTVRLSRREKVAGLHGDLRVPASAVTGAAVVEDPLAAPRGIRAPGTAFPGLVKIGTWRGRGGRTLVVAYRDQPGLRLTLTGQRVDEVVLSHPDAADVVARVRAAAGLTG